MINNLIVEKNCRLCGSNNIKKVFKLKPTPIIELYETSKQKALQHKKYPQTIARCSSCKHIQIIESVKPSYMWSNYTYLSSQTKGIKNHFRDFSRSVKKKYNIKNKFIIDIGGNDGSLLNNFNECSRRLNIEPSKSVTKFCKNKKISHLNEYLSLKIVPKIISKYEKAKLIFAFNVFAHTRSVKDFIKCIKNLLSDDGVFIFEAQYLGEIYKKFILGTFFHEHMSHHSIYSLNKVFKKNGLKLFSIKKNNIQNGSVLGFVTKESNKKIKIENSVNIFLRKEKKNKTNSLIELKKFISKIDEQKKLCQKILKENKKLLIGYGSARSGVIYTENYGIKYPKIIFDDHIFKTNKYSPYYGSKILPTKNLKDYQDTVCIILAYIHYKKIIKKNIKFLKKNNKFLIFFPTPKLISIKNYTKYV